MRLSFSSPLAVACAALLAGAALGYVAEAGARDRHGVSERAADQRGIDRGSARSEAGYGRGAASALAADAPADAVSVRGERGAKRWRDRYGAPSQDFRRTNDRRKGWRPMERATRRYALHGSFMHALPNGFAADFIVDDTFDGGGSRFVSFDPSAYGNGSFHAPLPSYPSAAKVIDVETERLDRRAVAPGGIETIYAGGAKIIRIAPDYDRSASLADDAASTPAARIGNDLQPWSAAWMKHCMEAYHSFDPQLGTYIARDGRVRFCETSR